MASGDTGGTGGTPTSPIRPMMSLEQVIAPVLTPLTGEASQQGGSMVTTTPTNELQRSTVEGPASYAVVMAQSTPLQTPHVTVISSSATPPTVDKVGGTPVLSQPPPLYQMVGEQLTVFQTPPLN
ncbi:unnamed protein product [Lactuca virosa]|uniref:Uncharacterized protein n=1 Tax=Lactuca virosa TaxID=75947 RepID=A0AAU9MI67_9ASTR|nr:unnamed protein product [Lactuca virosa]